MSIGEGGRWRGEGEEERRAKEVAGDNERRDLVWLRRVLNKAVQTSLDG